ncbi:MAG: DNA polymerase III subunit beta [Patescibacteria group bacterium]|nr:DNA polymerase III subunit beta [Patescibacteria group bacterium]
MKFSCLQEHLNKGLNQVSHLASKNVSLPILNNVLISCEKGIIKLSATNLEMGINTIVRGKVDEAGKITVPAKTLADHINLLPDEKIELTSQENNLLVKSKSTQTTIRGQSADEFPVIPVVEQKISHAVKAKDFKKSIGQVVYAVAQDESRPEISGVYIKIKSGRATIVATDSYRLAEKKTQLAKPNEHDVEAIIPTRTIQELARIVYDDANNLEMYFSDNQVMFVCEGVELISRIIEGQYPDYRQIIPQDYKTVAKFSCDEMIKAVKSAALFSKTGINDVNLKFNAKAGRIMVSSANTQLGESTTEIRAEITGEENVTVFNHRYLLDGLANLDTSQGALSLIDGSNPGTLTPKDLDDFLYIIMPIKQ